MECMLNRQIVQESSGGGDTNETWVLNETLNLSNKFSYDAEFISGGRACIKISFGGKSMLGQTFYSLQYYFKGDTKGTTVCSTESGGWQNPAYRKLTFATAPTGELLTWLQANGVKQEKNLAIQPSKSLTITSNGTTTITPDVPYDAIGQVGVTVNVASSGGSGNGFSITFPATATNWNHQICMKLYLYNGSSMEISDYSTIAGKKVNNIVGLTSNKNYGDLTYVLKMTLTSGSIAQAEVYMNNDNGIGLSQYSTTQSGGSTTTPYNGMHLFWWPLSDIVLSSIEMYDTD